MRFFGIFLALSVVSAASLCRAEDFGGFLSAFVPVYTGKITAPKGHERRLAEKGGQVDGEVVFVDEEYQDDEKTVPTITADKEEEVVPMIREDANKGYSKDYNTKRHITATINAGHHSLIALIDQTINNVVSTSTSTAATSNNRTVARSANVVSRCGSEKKNVEVVSAFTKDASRDKMELEHEDASTATGSHALVALVNQDNNVPSTGNFSAATLNSVSKNDFNKVSASVKSDKAVSSNAPVSQSVKHSYSENVKSAIPFWTEIFTPVPQMVKNGVKVEV